MKRKSARILINALKRKRKQSVDKTKEHLFQDIGEGEGRTSESSFITMIWVVKNIYPICKRAPSRMN